MSNELRLSAKARSSVAWRYGFALLAVGLAAVAGSLLSDLFGPELGFITFFPAVALVAMIAGGRAGLAATLLSAIIADWTFFVDSTLRGQGNFGHLVPLSFFVLGGLIVSATATTLRRAREAESRAHEREAVWLQTRRSKERFELLAETAGALLAARDPQRVVQDLCSRVMRHLGCDLYFNFLADETAQKLSLNAWSGITPEQAGTIKTLDFGTSVCGCVAEGRERMTFEHIQGNSDPRTALVRSWGVQAYCCHPLLAGDRLIGTLSFGSRERTKFDPDDVELMRAVADQVSVAMERMAAEAKVRETQERLRSVLQATGVGLWLNEMPLGKLTWDARTKELFFCAPEEAPTIDLFWNRLHPDDREPTRVAVERALSEHRHYSSDHRVVDPRSGAVRWLHSEGRGVYDADGKLSRFDGINYDITARKEAEERLEEARRKIERHAQDLEQVVMERTGKLRDLVGELEYLSYTITHDLRAPLRAIRGFSEMLAHLCSDIPRPDVLNFLKRIMLGAQRMDLLITDALNYTKAVRLELPLVPIDLGKLLRDIIDTYPDLASDKASIHLATPIANVLGNEAALTQCFSNLLSNAVKFVKPGQKAEVRVWTELVRREISELSQKPFVRVCVQDDGIGIAPGMIPKLFQLFSRGTSEYEGTGIGLALVRKVVQRMGGRVGVESRPGAGSRFWIELPSAEVPVREHSSEPIRSSATELQV